MIRKEMKMKDNVFSRNQLGRSVVPISELAHTNANAAINAETHTFFLKGTLYFEIAMVNAILFVFSKIGTIINPA
jgi:hypothetical protein